MYIFHDKILSFKYSFQKTELRAFYQKTVYQKMSLNPSPQTLTLWAISAFLTDEPTKLYPVTQYCRCGHVIKGR